MLPALSVLVCLGVAWLLISPFFMEYKSSSLIADVDESLFDQKERCIRLIKDIELDFQTGKLTEQEYESIKSTQYLELAGILNQLEKKA